MDTVTMIRLISFISVLVIFSLLQVLIPSRPFPKNRWQFMASNLVLVGANNIVLGLIPLVPYHVSVISAQRSYGLFNLVKLPTPLALILGLLILDMVIYFQHRLFHKIGFLWRLHSMHHIDPMLDTTSGLRFHPLEILISNVIKITTIFLFGVTPITVIVFEIVLNALAMFNHSNIALNKKLEHRINKILITPALHTIHHSKNRLETNSNYGFSVPWWDHLFGTFTAKGQYPQAQIHIGTVPMPKKRFQLFPGMLLQPFIPTLNRTTGQVQNSSKHKH